MMGYKSIFINRRSLDARRLRFVRGLARGQAEGDLLRHSVRQKIQEYILRSMEAHRFEPHVLQEQIGPLSFASFSRILINSLTLIGFIVGGKSLVIFCPMIYKLLVSLASVIRRQVLDVVTSLESIVMQYL